MVQRLVDLYTLLANCLDDGGTGEVGTAAPSTTSCLWPERKKWLTTQTHTRCPSGVRPVQHKMATACVVAFCSRVRNSNMDRTRSGRVCFRYATCIKRIKALKKENSICCFLYILMHPNAAVSHNV